MPVVRHQKKILIAGENGLPSSNGINVPAMDKPMIIMIWFSIFLCIELLEIIQLKTFTKIEAILHFIYKKTFRTV